MRITRSYLFALAFSALGCATDGDAPSSQSHDAVESDEATGTLQFKLTGVDSSGRSYRLRNARFEVVGWGDYNYLFPAPGLPVPDGAAVVDGGAVFPDFTQLVLDTESDPDAPFLTTKVVPGNYTINMLGGDWYIERLAERGWQPVEQVVLLSPPSQFVYVWDGGTSFVTYAFGVDGELIDFRSGDIQVGIQIEQPGDRNVDGGPGWPVDAGPFWDGGVAFPPGR